MRGISSMYRWLPGLMFVMVFPTCSKPKGPPPVPVIRAAAPSQATPDEVQEKVPGLRTHGGTPIAPVVLRDDTPASTPALGMPAGGGSSPSRSLNGDPRGLTQDSMNRSMAPVIGKIATCFSPGMGNPMVSLSFEAEPSGRASMLRVKGAPPESEYCIRKIMRETKFPSFEGKAVPIDLPLSFHQVGKPATRGAPAGPSGTPSTPLFLDP